MMHALVVYESMYGHTHAIATAIGEAMKQNGEVRVVPASDATEDLVTWADLVVVGAPTHARGLPTPSSRASAVETAAKPDGWSDMDLDPTAAGPGVREWLEGLVGGDGKRAAAFDTRVPGPALLTGRASNGIAKGLRDHGFRLVADPESFIVDTHQRLRAGEEDRAARWASDLVADHVPAG
jgi:hypothetical protein